MNALVVDNIHAAERTLQELSAKLGAAQERVGSLTVRHASVAFDSNTGVASVLEFQKVDDELSAAKFEVTRLAAARSVAVSKLNEARTAQRRHARADILKTFTRRANQRLKKAERSQPPLPNCPRLGTDY
jgi:hypothetical protein